MRLMGQDRTKRTIIGRKSPVSAIHVVAVCDYCGDRSFGIFGNACQNFSVVKPTRNNPTVTECATASSEFVIDESQHSLFACSDNTVGSMASTAPCRSVPVLAAWARACPCQVVSA